MQVDIAGSSHRKSCDFPFGKSWEVVVWCIFLYSLYYRYFIFNAENLFSLTSKITTKYNIFLTYNVYTHNVDLLNDFVKYSIVFLRDQMFSVTSNIIVMIGSKPLEM